MKNFSLNRIGSLLCYDWTLHKRTLLLSAIIIPLIYILMAFLAFVMNTELDFDTPNTGLPSVMASACTGYFSFAQAVAIIIITTLLTEKFCYPRTATAYLTLPGTSLEKVVTMFAEYIMAYIAVNVIYFVMYYATMGVGHLYAPELDWGSNLANVLANSNVAFEKMQDVQISLEQSGMPEQYANMFTTTITDFVHTAMWLEPFSTLMGLAFYMMLNMLFKTNVQIKAIACCVALYLAMVIGLIIAVCVIIGIHVHGNEVAVGAGEIFIKYVCDFMRGFVYYLYCTPILAGGFIYIFYRQVCAKQAK